MYTDSIVLLVVWIRITARIATVLNASIALFLPGNKTSFTTRFYLKFLPFDKTGKFGRLYPLFMNKKLGLIIAAVILIALGLGGFLLLNKGGKTTLLWDHL
jgi:hypothetical protein